MPFSQDQENAIRLIAESSLTKRVDERVERELRWPKIFVGALGVSAAGVIVFLFISLPRLAAAELKNQVTEYESAAREAIGKATQADELATKALEDATNAQDSVTKAIAIAASMDKGLLETAQSRAQTLIDTINADQFLPMALSALENRPYVVQGRLSNADFARQGMKSAAYWRTEAKAWNAAPMDADMTVEITTRSVVMINAHGLVRALKTGSLHLALIDPEAKRVYGRTTWYRHHGNDKPGAWHDNGGWAPFSIAAVVELDPGTYTFGVGSNSDKDSDWQLHHSEVQALVLPIHSLETSMLSSAEE